MSKQFDEISEQAKAASEKLKTVRAHTREQLEADAAAAHEKASEAADRFKETVSGAHKKASSQWQQVQTTWHEHVAKVRKTIKHKKNQLDAKEAARDADTAEAFALDAIGFAEGVIEEAAAASLDALYLRAAAQASAARAGS